ncbi:PhzF family phenazine biosynthesis isomerase [Streptomyces spongiicola]|uniref:PhzF family phenazine biosynthesis isomerase n=1 Tax=Streptomyces spongiicola TaxID=1690221 RepID=A0A388SZ62_9ACTN|nr:PhzF family phenazine biosynthesis isomerase [Streptomyces spongiicola]GBQ01958.1 PhzF family phenazine biosynthesis isomerase [Streptomyces spongiicola]
MSPRTHPETLRYTAFTTDPAGGNPAGVVLDAAALDDAAMRATAAEVGYSETAFVTAADPVARRFRLRYFSPLAEVAFCGHATVATAVALAERIGTGPLAFDTPVGEIALDTSAEPDGSVTATLTSVPTRSRPASDQELHASLTALHWSPEDLDPALPPHVAFGGNEHLVLAAATRERLAALDYDFDALSEVMHRHGWTTLQLVWREAGELFHARDPFPVGGVVEDPATGAAAAALGGYLRALGALPPSGAFTIRQGEDLGRPSVLRVEASTAEPRVRVSGQAVAIADVDVDADADVDVDLDVDADADVGTGTGGRGA